MRLAYLGLSWGILLALWDAPVAANDSLLVLRRAKATIAVLCSDSLAGRGYEHQGHLRAARYLAGRFKELGLQPVNPGLPQDSVYFQPFSITFNKIDTAVLVWGKHPLQVGRDYIPHAACPAAAGEYPLVDLGYGLPQDFAQAGSLAGKMVLLRERLPTAGITALTDSLKRLYASDGYKLREALKAKAVGVLLLRSKLTASFSVDQFPFPVLELKWAHRRLPRTVRIRVAAAVQTVESQNVVGYLPGTLHPDTALVLCAHYDHLGRQGGAFYPGANDNASGTAFLLSLAERTATTLRNYPYTLVFIGFGGEETGLNGSYHYVNHPQPLPLLQLRTALNFDLMGNGTRGATAVAATSYLELYRRFDHLNDTLHALPSLRARANAPNSDHYPFTLRGIPSLFFYTEGGLPFYHDVDDRPSSLPLPVFYQFGQLMVAALWQIAQSAPPSR